MYAEERKKRIKRTLLENQRIDVNTLSKLLNVSRVTIRRDLQELDEEGFLIKTHGGAILPGEDETAAAKGSSDFENGDEFSREKEIMGQIAQLTIPDGASVFLCPGSVCEYIAASIKSKPNLRVITTDIKVFLALITDNTNNSLSVMLPGGELDLVNMRLSGSITEQTLENMFFDYAIVEVDGISLERGYSTENASKFSIIKRAISQSNQTIIVCDHSKFDKQSLLNIGGIDMFSKVISTEKTPQKYKDYYFNNNIQLFTTFDVY